MLRVSIGELGLPNSIPLPTVRVSPQSASTFVVAFLPILILRRLRRLAAFRTHAAGVSFQIVSAPHAQPAPAAAKAAQWPNNQDERGIPAKEHQEYPPRKNDHLHVSYSRKTRKRVI